MGSSGKKRTTMAKLNRESKLRDKRADKEARKNARKLGLTNDDPVSEPYGEELDPSLTDTEDASVDETSDDVTPAQTAA
jgi:hypothetical protein